MTYTPIKLTLAGWQVNWILMPVEDLGGKAFIENYDLGCRMPILFTFVTVGVKGKTKVDSSFCVEKMCFFRQFQQYEAWRNVQEIWINFSSSKLCLFWSPPGFWCIFISGWGFQISHSFATIPLKGDNPAWKNSNLGKTQKKTRSKVGDIFRNLAKSVTCDISWFFRCSYLSTGDIARFLSEVSWVRKPPPKNLLKMVILDVQNEGWNSENNNLAISDWFGRWFISFRDLAYLQG